MMKGPKLDHLPRQMGEWLAGTARIGLCGRYIKSEKAKLVSLWLGKRHLWQTFEDVSWLLGDCAFGFGVRWGEAKEIG